MIYIARDHCMTSLQWLWQETIKWKINGLLPSIHWNKRTHQEPFLDRPLLSPLFLFPFAIEF